MTAAVVVPRHRGDAMKALDDVARRLPDKALPAVAFNIYRVVVRWFFDRRHVANTGDGWVNCYLADELGAEAGYKSAQTYAGVRLLRDLGLFEVQTPKPEQITDPNDPRCGQWTRGRSQIRLLVPAKLVELSVWIGRALRRRREMPARPTDDRPSDRGSLPFPVRAEGSRTGDDQAGPAPPCPRCEGLGLVALIVAGITRYHRCSCAGPSLPGGLPT